MSDRPRIGEAHASGTGAGQTLAPESLRRGARKDVRARSGPQEIPMKVSFFTALCLALTAFASVPMAQAQECAVGSNGCVCTSDIEHRGCRDTATGSDRCVAHAGPSPSLVFGFPCDPPN